MKNHGESLGTAGRTIKDPVSTRPSLHGRGHRRLRFFFQEAPT